MLQIQLADSLKKGNKGNLSDMEHMNVVDGARQARLTISPTAHLLGLSQPSPGFTENGPKRETIEWAAVVWRKMSEVRREWADMFGDLKKATGILITAGHNQ